MIFREVNSGQYAYLLIADTTFLDQNQTKR